MKHFTPLLIAFLLVILTGCNTTRKNIKSATSEQITEQATTSTETTAQNSEAITTQTNINEVLDAVIDFTRYEFTDGTTLDDISFPGQPRDKPRDREPTEPPNPGKGLKAITTGHVNLNKKSEQETETQATATNEQTTSQKLQSDTNSKVSQQSQTTEKEKRGLIYYLGAITAALIASGLIYFVVRLIRRKKNAGD